MKTGINDYSFNFRFSSREEAISAYHGYKNEELPKELKQKILQNYETE